MYTTLISIDEFQQAEKSNWLVFDCRFVLSDEKAGKNAYLKAHIPGAVYVHLEQDLTGQVNSKSGRHPLPDKEDFQERLRQLGVTPDRQIVIYDDSFGSIACRFWWLLRWHGIKNAAVLDGGFLIWQKHQLPVDSEWITPTASTTQFQVNDDIWVSTEALQNLRKSDSCHLIDVRAEARFLGIQEPFDPIAGHIPGAINIPFEDNLNLDGTFLPADELKQLYEEYVGQSKEAVLMCGSGVTACHTVLAMEHAGFDLPMLYAGSWSEWIRDPTREVIQDD